MAAYWAKIVVDFWVCNWLDKKNTTYNLNYSPFNKHLFHLGLTNSHLCRDCTEAEKTITHEWSDTGGVLRGTKQISKYSAA